MSASFPDDIINPRSIAKGTEKGSVAANMMSKAMGTVNVQRLTLGRWRMSKGRETV